MGALDYLGLFNHLYGVGLVDACSDADVQHVHEIRGGRYVVAGHHQGTQVGEPMWSVPSGLAPSLIELPVPTDEALHALAELGLRPIPRQPLQKAGVGPGGGYVAALNRHEVADGGLAHTLLDGINEVE